MTDLPAATEAVFTRFKDEWISAPNVLLTPYALDNLSIDPPAGSDGRGAPWVRLEVKHYGGGQETIGAPGNRKFGSMAKLKLTINVPPGSGRAATDDLVEHFKGMFEGRAIAGTTIRLKDVVVRELGEVDDGRWWASTCEVLFEYDQTK